MALCVLVRMNFALLQIPFYYAKSVHREDDTVRRKMGRTRRWKSAEGCVLLGWAGYADLWRQAGWPKPGLGHGSESDAEIGFRQRRRKPQAACLLACRALFPVRRKWFFTFSGKTEKSPWVRANLTPFHPTAPPRARTSQILTTVRLLPYVVCVTTRSRVFL